ncbi:MAG: D-erythronate dehydrogenase, partial [Rubricella sp.]
LVYHLAAVVSAEAEADFEKGYAVNLAAIQALLEAIRLEGNAPRFVFSSSLAVYGPPFPDPVPEDFGLRPQSSYGTQKAIGELLVADYARKGFIEGITLRLPTIVIRPGAANAAASGFLSGILREPLAGLPAELPVAEEARVWIASPRVAVESLAHAATLPHEVLAETPVLNLNGLSVSIGEMLDSLERAAGAEARARVSRVDRPEIARIVQSWPPAFVTERARALGFPADTSIDDIITDHLCATG